jgi:hypothetical protein
VIATALIGRAIRRGQERVHGESLISSAF